VGDMMLVQRLRFSRWPCAYAPACLHCTVPVPM